MSLSDNAKTFLWNAIKPKEYTPPDTGGLASPTAPVVRYDAPPMPEGVDFSTLWEDPKDPSIMGTIFSGIAAGCGILLILLHLFGK